MNSCSVWIKLALCIVCLCCSAGSAQQSPVDDYLLVARKMLWETQLGERTPEGRLSYRLGPVTVIYERTADGGIRETAYGAAVPVLFSPSTAYDPSGPAKRIYALDRNDLYSIELPDKSLSTDLATLHSIDLSLSKSGQRFSLKVAVAPSKEREPEVAGEPMRRISAYPIIESMSQAAEGSLTVRATLVPENDSQLVRESILSAVRMHTLQELKAVTRSLETRLSELQELDMHIGLLTGRGGDLHGPRRDPGLSFRAHETGRLLLADAMRLSEAVKSCDTEDPDLQAALEEVSARLPKILQYSYSLTSKYRSLIEAWEQLP